VSTLGYPWLAGRPKVGALTRRAGGLVRKMAHLPPPELLQDKAAEHHTYCSDWPGELVCGALRTQDHLDAVAHICNPRYLGGTDQEECSSKPAQANHSQDPISKISNIKKKVHPPTHAHPQWP
jgi:hypothetical protein